VHSVGVDDARGDRIAQVALPLSDQFAAPGKQVMRQQQQLAKPDCFRAVDIDAQAPHSESVAFGSPASCESASCSIQRTIGLRYGSLPCAQRLR
jgi:hypothetical protein